MRVIAGLARGRKLAAPENQAVRPTTDNVKESVFNIIQFDIEGRRILDLFAGTGQLGIECISRGAKEAVFVDSSSASLRLVEKNLKTCGFQAKTVQAEAVNYLKNCGKFDLIFVDPPYDLGLYEPVLKAINTIDILNDGGIIVCESRSTEVLPDMQPPYRKKREYRYGSVKISIFLKET